jgi:hypothetical protein
MTKIPADLDGARLNVSRTAELISMEAGHFRRLVRRGVFPAPKRTSKGMPYFDHELLCQIGNVLKSGVGLNNEEISFYRRQTQTWSPEVTSVTSGPPAGSQAARCLCRISVEGCRQVGVSDDRLDASRVTVLLAAEFAEDRPELQVAIPVIAGGFSRENELAEFCRNVPVPPREIRPATAPGSTGDDRI